MKHGLKLGWSEVSMTPEKKIRLAGQFYERISEYVETPITVTALAMTTDEDQMILCSVDIESLDPLLCSLAKEEIKRVNAEIDVDKIIVNATHTHTSFVYEGSHDPGLSALSKYLGSEEESAVEPDDPEVMSGRDATEFISSRIAKAVLEAWEARRESYFACGFGRAAVGMNRRVCYKDMSAKMWGDANTSEFLALEGGNDNGIELIFTYDESKKLTGVVANIACPAQILEQRSFISSDYWGKVKILLREKYGEELKVLGLCSPAGDQCPRDLVRWVEPETPIKDPNVIRVNPRDRRADPSMYDIKGSWRVGRRIATEIIAVEEDVEEYRSDAILIHRPIMQMPLPLRRVTEEENANARAALAEFAEKNKGKTPDFHDNAMMHVHAGVAARYDRQKTESVVPSEIHIARFGDVAFMSCPFELFLDFANIIRARSAALQTFLIQLASDSKGYLPTERAEKGGHYSAYVSSGHVGHEGGYMLVEETLETIEKMFKTQE